MDPTALPDVLRQIDIKNRQFEDLFRSGDMDVVVERFYTAEARYLTARRDLLIGRVAVAEFFRSISTHIVGLEIVPVHSYGVPIAGGTVCQFCNTIQHLADGNRAYGHYAATFQQIDGEWLCDMEAPNPGWIGGGEPTA